MQKTKVLFAHSFLFVFSAAEKDRQLQRVRRKGLDDVTKSETPALSCSLGYGFLGLSKHLR